MRLYIKLVFVFLCAGLTPGSAALASSGDPWAEVLQQVGLTKEQIHFDALDLQNMLGADLQGPFFKVLYNDPLRIPFYARYYRDILLGYADKPFDVTTSAVSRIGFSIRRTLTRDPFVVLTSFANTEKNPLLEAIAHAHSAAGKPLNAAQKGALLKKIKGLSPDAAKLVAILIEIGAESYSLRQKALIRFDSKFLQSAFAERTDVPQVEGASDDTVSEAVRRLIREADLKTLVAGGLDLVYVVQKSREMWTNVKPGDQFEWTTPIGEVIIRGDSKDNVYPGDKPYLLIIDAGGNDTYYGGGGSFDVLHPVSVVIDLKGDDKYLSEAALGENVIGAQAGRKAKKIHPSFGAGVFGYGVLVDVEGDDLYRSYRQTQGRGDFGIGLLWDLAGNDRSDCWVGCQGAGEFGGGILIDEAGADHYATFQQGQGFGGPSGAGLLLDSGKEGDEYAGNRAQIDFPSLIDRKENVSFLQGASLGVRADVSDGYSLAGGFGALVDGGGDNTYTAGFFAQGIAYWYGVGWLSSGTGRDKYTAGKYAQGAATHFGVGILHDAGGDDSYFVAQELGIGHGHDFAIGFLLDDSGNDIYNAPNFSLGCASAQGLGFFWDRSGDDRYVTKEKETLGCASFRIDLPSFRITSRTLGVFLDTGGKNEFDTPNKELKGRHSSLRWTSNPLSLPQNMPAKWQSRVQGVGLVTDDPDAADPF